MVSNTKVFLPTAYSDDPSSTYETVNRQISRLNRTSYHPRYRYLRYIHTRCPWHYSSSPALQWISSSSIAAIHRHRLQTSSTIGNS